MKRIVRSSVLLGGAFLLASCFGGLFSTLPASAHLSACRSDPMLTLSNGAKVTLYEDISDGPTDITSISYRVHLPTGVRVTSVQYNGDVPSSQQTITVTADETIGNYDAYTTVYTKTPEMSVTAYMSGTTAGGTTITSTHTSGHSGQQLHSHLHL